MLLEQDVRQLMNQCRVELLGVSDAGLKSKMYDVMFEFFDTSSIWKERITLNVVPNKRHFHIEPTEGQIVRLDAVLDSQGTFQAALLPNPGTDELLLEHAVNVAQQFFVHVIKNVSLPTSKDLPIAPDWVLKKWFLAIKHGIIGNMKNEKDKSYSDPKGALFHLSKFNQGMANARSQALRANTQGASAWRFPQSYRANTQQGGVPSFGGGQRTF